MGWPKMLRGRIAIAVATARLRLHAKRTGDDDADALACRLTVLLDNESADHAALSFTETEVLRAASEAYD